MALEPQAGQPVTWIDKDGFARTGTFQEMDNYTLIVKCDETGEIIATHNYYDATGQQISR